MSAYLCLNLFVMTGCVVQYSCASLYLGKKTVVRSFVVRFHCPLTFSSQCVYNFLEKRICLKNWIKDCSSDRSTQKKQFMSLFWVRMLQQEVDWLFTTGSSFSQHATILAQYLSCPTETDNYTPSAQYLKGQITKQFDLDSYSSSNYGQRCVPCQLFTLFPKNINALVIFLVSLNSKWF